MKDNDDNDGDKEEAEEEEKVDNNSESNECAWRSNLLVIPTMVMQPFVMARQLWCQQWYVGAGEGNGGDLEVVVE